MREILEHKAYNLLKNEYNKIALDYVILSFDCDYKGIDTHKEAVIEAFRILSLREDYYADITLESEKMNAETVMMEDLLKLPEDEYYDGRPKKKGRSFSIENPIPYWYAFLQPPYDIPYLKSDFITFNDVLFPDRNCCEAYRWNDEFSTYFDEGKEWWGTGLWSIFDRSNNTFTVIAASLTD